MVVVPKRNGCDDVGVLAEFDIDELVVPNNPVVDVPLVVPNMFADPELVVVFCPRPPNGLLAG